jgi:hypothetical protein
VRVAARREPAVGKEECSKAHRVVDQKRK